MGKRSNVSFILIIIFLSIFSILGLSGLVFNIMGVNKVEVEKVNTNHEFKFDGKLYFYDKDNLLGKYTCDTNACDYASVTIDDKNYSLNSVETSDYKLKLIDNRYAFIDDGKIILYDVVKGRKIDEYKAVKQYETPIADNYYILKYNDDTWGVLKLGNITATNVIEFKYDFIGVNQIMDEKNNLSNTLFVAKDNQGWKIINNNGVDQSSYFVDEIYDYNESYIITKTKGGYYILSSYDGVQKFSYDFTKLDFVNRYVAAINSDYQFYILDPVTLREVSSRYRVNSIDDVKTEVTLNGIEISINGALQETVSLN